MKVISTVAKYVDVEVDIPDEYFDIEGDNVTIKDEHFSDMMDMCANEAADVADAEETEVLTVIQMNDERYRGQYIWECY